MELVSFTDSILVKWFGLTFHFPYLLCICQFLGH